MKISAAHNYCYFRIISSRINYVAIIGFTGYTANNKSLTSLDTKAQNEKH